MLHGRTVLVTGASSGIGRTTALVLADLGAHVLAGMRTPQELGTGITPVELDITNAAQVEALRAHELDALVNNAGIATTGPLEFLPLDELRRQLEVNMIAQLAVTPGLHARAAPQPGADRQRVLDLRSRRAAALRAVHRVEVRTR